MLQWKVALLLLLSVVASFLLTVQRHFQNPFLICSAYFYNVMHPQKLEGHLGAVEDDEAAGAGRGGDGLPAGLSHQGAPHRSPVPGMTEHSALLTKVLQFYTRCLLLVLCLLFVESITWAR